VNILIDMNLSPEWTAVFTQAGWQSVHWSTVGDPRATDRVIMEFARSRQFIVFTHDLDFGDLLTATNAEGPSVILVRTQDVMPSALGALVVEAIRQHESALRSGALIVVEEAKTRVRILPIKR
jgi:predicted nuclease of predicted toxin-antitoxin system